MIICLQKVHELNESSPASASVQTVDHSLKPVTSKDSSTPIPTLVAQAVAAACRQRLLGYDRCSTDGRPADKVATDRPERRERRHRCPQCGDLFSSSTVLRRHHLVHSGQQPWTCGHCAAKFSLKYNCSRHCRSKHPGLPILVVSTPRS